MKKAVVWALGLGVAAAVPILALTVAVPAVRAAADSVQAQTALDSIGVAHQETTLGDLVADAARASGGADLALVPADEITETTISSGSVPVSRIVGALRYHDDPADTIVILKLSGKQIRLALERSVSRAPQPFDGFFQVSGLQISYDPAKPSGSRVTSLTINGAPLQDTQTYQVATTHSIADGSFGYFGLWNPSDIAQDTHTTLADALTAYLAAHRTLNVSLDHRITS